MVEAAALGELAGVHDEQFVKHHTERSLSLTSIVPTARPSAFANIIAAPRAPPATVISPRGPHGHARSAAGLPRDINPLLRRRRTRISAAKENEQ
mmetsp:Transcript_8055/g.27558  ORF Transcript_8055/g.27558 Transcript_8055/m.27558 type:complete len:95 (-) Transcript_8055:225-509(-)